MATTDKITATQLLFPLSLVSFVLVVFLGFQTTLLLSDRAALQQLRMGQDKPLEQVAKVKEQVNALAVGTLKLAKGGNKNAENIIGQMKKAGIDIQDQAPPGAAGQQPAPQPSPRP